MSKRPDHENKQLASIETEESQIIGGIFGTGKKVVMNADGEVEWQQELFNIRLYKSLWTSETIKRLVKGSKLPVLLTIAMHVDADAECWPSQRLIADLLGLNKDTVGKALKELEADGFIERETTRDEETGRFGTTQYKLKFKAKPVEPKAPSSPKKSDRKKFKPVPKNRTGKSVDHQSEKTIYGDTDTGATNTGDMGHKYYSNSFKDDLSSKDDLSFIETPPPSFSNSEENSKYVDPQEVEEQLEDLFGDGGLKEEIHNYADSFEEPLEENAHQGKEPDQPGTPPEQEPIVEPVVDPEPWKSDEWYQQFNKRCVEKGAMPIRKHDLHYPNFVAFQKRMEDPYTVAMLVANYLHEKGKDAKIAWFYAGGYNDYLYLLEEY